MKKIFLTALALMVSVAGFAQFRSKTGNQMSAWHGFHASVDIYDLNTDFVILQQEQLKGTSFESLVGFSLGYSHAFRIAPIPLFIEPGAQFSYAAATEETRSRDDVKLTNVRLSIPVNVGYKIAFNENHALVPYAGLSYHLNVGGKLDGVDLYDTDKGYGKMFNRSQLGGQIGVKYMYNHLMAGFSYNLDFTDWGDLQIKLPDYGELFREKLNKRYTSFTIGYIF